MNLHPRLRRTFLCSSAAALLLITAAWAASGYGYMLYQSRAGRYACIQRGCLILGNFQPPQPTPGFDRGRNVGDPRFLWSFWSANPWGGWIWFIPLWIPAAPVTLLTAGATWLELRARLRECLARNACPTCHYDRTGLTPGAPCPECGAPAP